MTYAKITKLPHYIACWCVAMSSHKILCMRNLYFSKLCCDFSKLCCDFSKLCCDRNDNFCLRNFCTQRIQKINYTNKNWCKMGERIKLAFLTLEAQNIYQIISNTIHVSKLQFFYELVDVYVSTSEKSLFLHP
jgi:hypothetical protein